MIFTDPVYGCSPPYTILFKSNKIPFPVFFQELINTQCRFNGIILTAHNTYKIILYPTCQYFFEGLNFGEKKIIRSPSYPNPFFYKENMWKACQIIERLLINFFIRVNVEVEWKLIEFF